MERVIVIMAGGHGERFWPSSRKSLPKQFLCLTDREKTMIQLTVDRVVPLVGLDHVFIVTGQDYRGLVREQIPELPEENILLEPVGRNTTAAIALGAVHAEKRYGDAVMTVLPSDHLIKYPFLFRDTLTDAARVAEDEDRIVTIGILPDEPETGYGYIKFHPEKGTSRAYPVERFVEKPDLETAKKYVASSEYLWNSGMFTWKVSTILANLKRYVPEMMPGIARIRDAIGTAAYEETLKAVYAELPSVSIDYAVMEKAENICTIAGGFGWDDVGSWLAVSRLRERDRDENTLTGNVIAVDTEDTIIQGTDKLIATVGLRNMIIVDTKDALLVCDKDSAGDIKKLLKVLRDRDMTQYL